MFQFPSLVQSSCHRDRDGWRPFDTLRIPGYLIDAVTADEQRELQRRQREYRDDRPAPQVQGKTVIVIDDGIATGSTMLAAVAALRKLKAGSHRRRGADNRAGNL